MAGGVKWQVRFTAAAAAHIPHSARAAYSFSSDRTPQVGDAWGDDDPWMRVVEIRLAERTVIVGMQDEIR